MRAVSHRKIGLGRLAATLANQQRQTEQERQALSAHRRIELRNLDPLTARVAHPAIVLVHVLVRPVRGVDPSMGHCLAEVAGAHALVLLRGNGRSDA